MAQPFTCPHCGAHDYSIVLSGADVAGATLREDFHWDSATGEYTSEGTIVLDSQSVESESARAISVGGGWFCATDTWCGSPSGSWRSATASLPASAAPRFLSPACCR